MQRFVFFDGEIVDAGHPTIPAVSSAALYGRGIFTTISIINGLPFLWDKHWQRLCSNSQRIGLDLAGFTKEKTKEALVELIQKNQTVDGRARITFFDCSAGGTWSIGAMGNTNLLIISGKDRTFTQQFRLALSSFRVNSQSPLAGIKSCNYLDKQLTLDEARSLGFNEALQLNERGKVTSAVMANVFWLKDVRLYTPSLATGCMAGTTREFVLENFECDEVEAGIEELDLSDSIFLTSAGFGVVRVAEFNGRKLPGHKHEIQELWPR